MPEPNLDRFDSPEAFEKALDSDEDYLRWLGLAAAKLGYRLVAIKRRGAPSKTHCHLGHPLKLWPCGERSCPVCKAEGVRARRALRRTSKPRGA